MITSLVVVVFFGAIVDFEQKLEARHDANVAAEEAARAGAGQVDRDRAYVRGGTLVIDHQAALSAAQQYLRNSGYRGSVTVLDGRKIRVRVAISRHAIFLPFIGINTLTVQADAVADLVTGAEGEVR